MGRTLPTGTMQVYAFEREWQQFARAPRKADRQADCEAFGALVALAHFHAAAIAHAGSPYAFEMIVLAMLVGLVRRIENLHLTLDPAPDDLQSGELESELGAVMDVVRQRLATQKRELYTFARALRTEDQRALRDLLTGRRGTSHPVTPHLVTSHVTSHPVTSHPATPASDEMLLASLVRIMRRLLNVTRF